MRVYTDWNCKLLPMMHDLIANPKDSLEAMLTLNKLGMNRFCMMPEFDCQQESIALFLLHRNRALNELAEITPKSLRFFSAATLVLSEGSYETKGLHKLCIPKTDYLPVRLPMEPKADWLARELNQFLYHLPIRPLFMNFETYSLFYPLEMIDRLLALPNAAYQFNYRSLTDNATRTNLRCLLKRNAPILFGSSVNSAAKAYYYEFPHFIETASSHFNEFERDNLFFRKKIYLK